MAELQVQGGELVLHLFIFAAVHHDTPRGVRVLLRGTSCDEWIVGCADPEAVAAGLPVPG